MANSIDLEHMNAIQQEHAVALAALREQTRGHEEEHARHRAHFAKLDEQVAILRETMASVATKDDIMALRKDVASQFNQNLRDAHNSVPAKMTMLFGGAMFLIALVGLVINLRHG